MLRGTDTLLPGLQVAVDPRPGWLALRDLLCLVRPRTDDITRHVDSGLADAAVVPILTLAINFSEEAGMPTSGPGTQLEVSVSKGLLAAAVGALFDKEYYLDPTIRHEIDSRCHAWVRDELGDIGAFFTESNLGRLAHFDDRQVLVGGIQPNLILGMLLGAEFLPHPSGDADISPQIWAGRSISDLPNPADLLDHDLVKLFDRQIEELRSEGALIPVPPFFWDGSGRAAAHGALTTAQKFLGEGMFMDMLEEPARVRTMMEWITEANMTLVQHFADAGRIDVTQVHIGECSSCMIGPDQWTEFVVPTLIRIGDALGPLRLHSCGMSDHILDKARALDRLNSLDVGGETSLVRVRELFGPELSVSMAPPVRTLTAETAEPLLAWLDRVLDENAGGNLTVLIHIEPQYSLDAIRTFCRASAAPSGHR